MLNYPNVSIGRGLESINGYDALRMARMSKVAGDMTLDGIITDKTIFGAKHRGFDLFNVDLYMSGARHGRIEQPRPRRHWIQDRCSTWG